MSLTRGTTAKTSLLSAALIGAWLALSVAAAASDGLDLGNVPTPGLTQEQVDALVGSTQTRCQGDRSCYQQQQALQFNRFSMAYDKTLKVSDKTIRQGLHHFCTDPTTHETPFYEVAPCSLNYHLTLQKVIEAASTELRESGQSAWFEQLKNSSADNPRITTAMRLLAVAVHENCPGDTPQTSCARAYLSQLARNERRAVEQARIAQDASSRLSQTVGACLKSLDGDDTCRRRQALLAVNGERWQHALTQCTTEPYAQRIPYEPVPQTPTRSVAQSFFGGTHEDTLGGADAIVQCVRRKNSGNDIQGALTGENVCKSIEGTPLAGFGIEVSRIEAHLTIQSYFDLVRLIGVSRLLDAHQRFVGAPLTELPASCRGKIEDGFHQITSAARNLGPETPDQRQAIASELRAAAVSTVDLLATQMEAKTEVDRAHGKKGNERCDYFLGAQPGHPRCASEQYGDATRLIEQSYGAFPLLSAGRDPGKTEFADSGQVFAFATAKDSELEQALNRSRNLLSHSISEGVAQLCSVGQEDGLDWRDLEDLPINNDPLWDSRFPQFKPLRDCLHEVRHDEKVRRAHATTVLGITCFFSDIPTVGLASAGCDTTMASQKLDEAAHAITWIGRCRAAGNAFCEDANLTSARMRFEQSTLELSRATQQAGLSVLAIGAGLGALRLSTSFAKAGVAQFDSITAKTRLVDEALTTGRITDQVGLDAELGRAQPFSDVIGPVTESGSSPTRVTPPLSAGTQAEVAGKLGIPESKIELRPFKSGQENDVYDLVARDGSEPIHFGSGPEINPSLRGKTPTRYKIKLSYKELKPGTVEREEKAFAAIRDELEHDPQNEGLHIAETHIIGYTRDGRRIIAQATQEGTSFLPTIKASLEPAISRIGLSDTGMRNLFADLYQHQAQGEFTVEQIFEPAHFREHLSTVILQNPGLSNSMQPLLSLTDTEIAALQKAWQSPDMLRVQELTGKLQNLNYKTSLSEANAPLHPYIISNTPLWGNHEIPLNADFGHKNVIFWRDARGLLNLTIVDF